MTTTLTRPAATNDARPDTDHPTLAADLDRFGPPLSTARISSDTAQWPVWSTTARIVVTEPAILAAAYDLARLCLLDVDEAASRFRDDSELAALDAAGGTPTRVSSLLRDLLSVALDAARATDGDVDPTLGADMTRIGYDRDFAHLTSGPSSIRLPSAAGSTSVILPSTSGRGPVRPVTVCRRASWHDIRMDGDVVTVPASVRLDLGATAKAFTADLIAGLVADQLDTGVLVSLGGDIATAGPGPEGGWRVLVSDGPGEPAAAITLPAGSAVASSSTIRRRWVHDGRPVHHILDPRTGQPATPVWRTVTVAAASCVRANTLTTAAVVRGSAARNWLAGRQVPARLVAQDSTVAEIGGWPH